MTAMVTLTAGDLVLRPWRPEDRAPFAALNADPEVMRHFPAPLTRAQSDALVDRIEADFQERGWGLWAVDAPGLGFVGFVGLNPVTFDPPFRTPEVPPLEVGWRLSRAAWGHGRAPRAARAALAFAFGPLGRQEVVSFTSRGNRPSRRVMEKIGMTQDPEGDFDHPRIPAGAEHLRRHVLYRLASSDFVPPTASSEGADPPGATSSPHRSDDPPE